MLLSLIAALVVSGPVQLIKATINDMSWMAGDWTCTVWGGTYQENWLSPTDGVIPGVGRFVKDGKLKNIEFDAIQENKEGSLELWIRLGLHSSDKQKRVRFPLVSRANGRFVFENKENDFPQMISYEMKPDGQRLCHIEGLFNGKTTSTDFPFKLAK